MKDRKTDVVVVGSGMGGLVSAKRALEYDAEVVVLEKGPRTGGKTKWASGLILTDDEAEAKISPFEPIGEALEWLSEQGVQVKDPEASYGELKDIFGDFKQLDTPDLVKHMTALIREEGGEIYTRTPMKELLFNSRENCVDGVLAADSETNETFEISARSVVLATGGYGASEDFVEKYITDDSAELILRGDPWSTGDGLEAAQNVGAKTTTGMSQFKGHSMIARPAEYKPDKFRDATQYYGPRSIALNRDGQRFIDESKDVLEDRLVIEIAKNQGGHAYYVLDKNLYDANWVGGKVGNIIQVASEMGGPIVEAATIEDLAEKMTRWDVNKPNMVDTITGFNEHVRENNGADLVPSRRNYQQPIDEPPFYAVGIQPGITYTVGGLDVNKKSQVLSKNESCSALDYSPGHMDEVFYNPIGGLYAAGVDVGNPYDGYFFGSLDQALVTGKKAGKHAALSTEGD